jgi:ATP-binding cassette, subfamily C, bacterial
MPHHRKAAGHAIRRRIQIFQVPLMASKEPRRPGFLRNMWTAFSAVPLPQGAVVVFGLTVAGILELFGLATIVPLVLVLDPMTHMESGGRKEVIREAVDAAFATVGLETTFVTLLLAVLVFLSIKAIIGILVMRYVANVMARINTEARLKVIRTLMQARWSFYTRQRLSRLVAAAGDSANAVGDAFQVSADLLTSLLRILVYLSVCYIIAPLMILVAAAAAVVMALSYGQLVRRSKRAAKLQNRAMNQMKADLTDVFISIKSIRAMGRQAKMATLLAKDSDTLDERMKSRVLSSEFADELQAPLIAACLVAGLVGGSMLLDLGGHELLIVAILLVRLVNTFGVVQRSSHRLTSAHIRLNAGKRLLTEAELSQEQFAGQAVPDPRQGVRFEGVSFKHADGRALLVDAGFFAPPGKITTLVGPSGIGKTTVLDLILGLLLPKGGRILMGGIDSPKVDLLKWRQMVGYVPQDVTLFHDSIRNNIALGEKGYSDDEVWWALRAAGADEFIEELPLKLDHVVGERGQMISGGQRQRIALARALLHRPAILILDEATAGLDHATEAGICQRIREMVDKDGLTVISVSHGDAWRAIADHVFKLADAKLIAIDPAASADIVPLGKSGPALSA